MTPIILAAMEEAGVTQAELARRIGMSPSQLSRMLRDPDHNYTVHMLDRIASALDAPLNITMGAR